MYLHEIILEIHSCEYVKYNNRRRGSQYLKLKESLKIGEWEENIHGNMLHRISDSTLSRLFFPRFATVAIPIKLSLIHISEPTRPY